MNKAQNKIVRDWYYLIIFVCILIGIELSSSDNKQMLHVFIGVPAFILLMYFTDIDSHRGWGINKESMGDFINQHIYLKLWLVFYCLCNLPFIIFNIYTRDEFTGWLYFIAFLLIIGPLFIFSERQRYIQAGENA